MNKISTHLWFDKEALAAAKFYTTVFPNCTITSSTSLDGTPSGSVDMVSLNLSGSDIAMISAGPVFKINPSVSFLYSFNDKTQLRSIWNQLVPGGKIMMELDKYPFSEYYGWIEDKFGVSWQLFYTHNPITQVITPTMMFTKSACGKCEEAINFYTSIFHDSKIGDIMRYDQNDKSEKAGNIKHIEFSLENLQFAAMESAQMHDFSFNEAISFIVHCKDQAEIDYYWEKLSAVKESEQCGWLKDKYGFSWQIIPNLLGELLSSGTGEQKNQVTEAFLKMKKFDIVALQSAFDGK